MGRIPADSAACWNSTAPYTPLVSVQARVRKPRATAASTSACGLEAPKPKEKCEWEWRCVKGEGTVDPVGTVLSGAFYGSTIPE